MSQITIAHQFNGPPDSGNGGYSCGLVAAQLEQDRPVQVTLHAPPPLDRPLQVVYEDENEASSDEQSLQVLDGETLIASAVTTDLDIEHPAAPNRQQALKAAEAYSGFKSHPFPGCFVCGPDRPVQDGLRIFAGPLDDSSQASCDWQPYPSLGDGNGIIRPEIIWAALDCPSYFGAFIGQDNPKALLGRMTLRFYKKQASVNDTYIISAWPISNEGRKYFGGSALFNEQGEFVALARATWIRI